MPRVKSQKLVEKAEKKSQPAKLQSKKPQPKPVNKKETREIDAAGKVLGRLATEIAIVLRGKDKPSFRPNLVVGDNVHVVNASKIVITGRKLEQKKYYHHTGYLGHLKEKSLKELLAKDPSDVVKRAVYGMLPDNKLRPILMKNLEIEN